MDKSKLIDGLNDPQRQAVSAPLGNYLVLAGAGSGKTRVLVHRIAWLIEIEQISPFAVLAVTFTNKAAAEMRGRIEELLAIPVRGMWVGTFHGLAHRFLRSHWHEAGLPEGFQIIDSDDQYRLIRRILKNLEMDEAKWAPRQVQYFINNKKDEGLRAEHIDHGGNQYAMTMVRLYREYQEMCERTGLIDFAEMLLRTHELLLKNEELRLHYQNRFQAILVDEFQDTNSIQYAWLKLIAGKSQQVMIVGDDDQSIYGWRGARIENIHRFAQEFSATTIRLEQNYRSTQTILQAANAVIANNGERLGKELWSDGKNGEPISIYAAINEIDEARFIVARIADAIKQGRKHDEIAVLYRSNAQSRVIEEALITAGIAYRVYGGLRFFERAEIKDALAYLRLLDNRNDDPAFERVVNTPTRGIGDATINECRLLAKQYGISLWQASEKIIAEQSLSARAANALQAFLNLIGNMAEQTRMLALSEITETVLQQSTLLQYYAKSKGEKAQSRVENLQELITACKQFNATDYPDMPILSAFLSHAALEAGDAQSNNNQACVQLMSLHSAKGLEFPLVFIGGVEEGLFPHQMSVEEPGRLEEERRLCYVGMTRAMEKLYLSYAEMRRLHGREAYHTASRFLSEIPDQLLDHVRMKAKVSVPASRNYSYASNAAINDSGFRLGDRVKHQKFGEGIVLNYEGSGSQARVQVKFKKEGTKWLMLSYANLSAVTVGTEI